MNLSNKIVGYKFRHESINVLKQIIYKEKAKLNRKGIKKYMNLLFLRGEALAYGENSDSWYIL